MSSDREGNYIQESDDGFDANNDDNDNNDNDENSEHFLDISGKGVSPVRRLLAYSVCLSSQRQGTNHL